MAEERQEGNILHPLFFLLPGRARLADKASSSRSRAFTFLGPAGLSVLLLLLLQTPEAGAVCRHQAALGWGQCTNGEGQGEGSFKIIYKHITKFHYFCFADSSTEEYKSSRIACLPQRFSTVWGSPLHLGHQEHRRTQGPDEFQGQRDAQA